MEKSNGKYAKGEEQGSHDALQNNHDQILDNSTSSCWTYYISWKTKGFSWGIYFH